MMTKKDIVKQYIAYLENAEITKIVGLFTDTGMVDSPLYGVKKANDFYTELANNTSNSELRIKGIFEAEDSDQVALYFTYNWTLKNNENVVFDVVDIFGFDAQNKITTLKIVYDTVVARQLLQKLNT